MRPAKPIEATSPGQVSTPRAKRQQAKHRLALILTNQGLKVLAGQLIAGPIARIERPFESSVTLH